MLTSSRNPIAEFYIFLDFTFGFIIFLNHKNGTTRQFEKYLHNRGYYNATVKDSVVKTGQKLDLYYTVETNEPYIISSVEYEFADNSISSLILSDTASGFVKQGAVFDVKSFQKERNRITRQMKEAGYYFFRKDFITFQVDSTVMKTTDLVA